MYVDLSNLYGGIAELVKPGEYFDFSTLLPLINKEFKGIDKIKVYGAYMGLVGITNPRDVLFIKAQNEFFNSARLSGVHFGKGNISRYGQEKGVDMQLGVDMVNDAHTNLYDDAIIFTGDADFAYPITIVKSLKKNLHYCSFATRYSNFLSHQAWRKVIIDYNNYFANKVLPTIKSPPKKLVTINIDSTVKLKSV
jgi:uncharacterized LabA/DUF88 family protein